MSNIRIYQLAKQLGKQSKELVEELKRQGLEVKSYMSTVDEETAKLVVNIFAPKKEKKPEAVAGPSRAPARKGAPGVAKKPATMPVKEAKAPRVEVKEKKEEETPAKEPVKRRAAVRRPSTRVASEVKAEIPPAAGPSERQEPVMEEVKAEVAAPAATAVKEPPAQVIPIRGVALSEALTVKELAEKLKTKAADVIKTLMQMGVMAHINQVLDFDTSQKVAEKHGFQAAMALAEAEEEAVEEAPEVLEPRPPVVTVMGHVDHGKTRLLDAIRQTNVVEKEIGGITQHIGASVAEVDGRKIVFLDTPGHEAFTAMRARGAQVTDIVVLVVAADDGVMPQTREAIAHAKAAGVPIVVAVNKIDKPEARPERVKQQLSELGLMPEQWGGGTIFCEVSAKGQTGINELLEMILLQAEIMELKANPHRLARGTIIEAKLDKGRGPVCTVLVQEGVMKVGDSFVCGLQYGKVRAMFSDKGKRIHEATPAMPVEVLGVSDVPRAGDAFQVVEEERKARQIGYLRQQKHREEALVKTARITLEDLYQRIKEGQTKELNIVLKTDVHGSLQAISDVLEKQGTGEVKVRIIHSSVGGIRETDVGLASASEAVIIGFNVRPTPQASEMAEREGVDIRLYTIIYDLISEVRAAMEGLLEPITREAVLGRAEVREIFNISRIGTIAGSYVVDGMVRRDSNVRVIRDEIVVYEGKVSSLRRFKEDVREVSSGYECGISVEGFGDLKQGDVLETYELREVSKKL